MQIYPYFSASLTNPLLFFKTKLTVPGWASNASAAPPTTRIRALPVPSLVRFHSILSFVAAHAPVNQVINLDIKVYSWDVLKTLKNIKQLNKFFYRWAFC